MGAIVRTLEADLRARLLGAIGDTHGVRHHPAPEDEERFRRKHADGVIDMLRSFGVIDRRAALVAADLRKAAAA